ncbi:hypothetical protein OsJ_30220 [Oryza sativa Japonica Group]|uniref:Auxin induced protein n=5 Tax=Oryza TaxID=4527 RepID=B9G4V9_ORYSJ|nr:hypothetical protein OsJ_30220 [Oryza sativa Japonica Group]
MQRSLLSWPGSCSRRWYQPKVAGTRPAPLTIASAPSSLAGNAHCTVYTADGARFEVPLPYLGTMVFGELLMMSQEEFGFAGDDGRITLPCDASVMESADQIAIYSKERLYSGIDHQTNYSNLSVSTSFLQSKSSFSQEHRRTMISSRKLAQLGKKWQRMVASSGRQTASIDGCCSTATAYVADKGHCVLYTTDGARFEVPLMYLNTAIFCELLRVSQEEFGFASNNKITLPCDASVMEYVMCLIRRDASEEIEKALLSSIVRPCLNTSVVPPMRLNQQFAVCS